MAFMTDTHDNQPLRLILPAQKRLRDAFDAVSRVAGFSFEKISPRAASGQLFDKEGFLKPIVSYELRPDAALDWLSEGAADLAVVGADMLAEYQADHPEAPLTPLLMLERVARCSLWIAAKPEIYILHPEDLGDMRLATTYPAYLQQWLQQNNVKPGRLLAQKGNVEAAIEAGRADAILDIVETGASLAANGLEKKLHLFNSHAVLVRHSAAFSEAVEGLTQTLSARLAAAEVLAAPAAPSSINSRPRPLLE